ncbi:MAG: imidazole glycerol phosphate synthase subunit HisH [Bacteroidales bacterium]|nr:imidazole glycerol phosphate synthase subunit HisH [Bacteroidales bacterium]MBP5763668.1 imidazole glycerol phosphate synthase subunit HisH [Bacteroidales bacterium]
MKVAIVKYNAGNIYSVYCACKRLGFEPVITNDPEELRNADKVIFPGVGEARAAMDYLNGNGLSDIIRALKQPVLGICIGMQLLCRHSEEGNVDCLGIFDVPVERFRPENASFKVPQMGWNTLRVHLAEGRQADPLLEGIANDSYVYYVHSYRVPVCADTIAVTDYCGLYSAALHKDNFWATQFHPEKSGSVGERILANFLNDNAVLV